MRPGKKCQHSHGPRSVQCSESKIQGNVHGSVKTSMLDGLEGSETTAQSLDVETLDVGLWTLNLGHWTLDVGLDGSYLAMRAINAGIVSHNSPLTRKNRNPQNPNLFTHLFKLIADILLSTSKTQANLGTANPWTSRDRTKCPQKIRP